MFLFSVIPEERFWNHKNTLNTRRAKILKLVAKLLLGLNVGIKIIHGRPVWFLKKDTIPVYEFFNVKPEEPKIRYKGIVEEIGNRDTLVLSTDIKPLCYDHLAISNKIAKSLEKQKAIVKSHPRDFSLYGFMMIYKRLPRFIPAELLMQYNWKYIIGFYCSKSLISAKKLTAAKVITLMNLYKWKHPKSDFKDDWEQRMKDAGVLVPSSFDELERLLEDG